MVQLILYETECLFEGRESNGYHMMITCGHQYHKSCLERNVHGIQCPYCKQIGDFIISDDIVKSKLEIIFEQLKIAPKILDFKAQNLLEILIFPVLQTINNIKLICTDRLNNNIYPVLQLVTRMIYSSADIFNFPSFLYFLKLYRESVSEETSPLDSEFNDQFSCNLECICPESLFGRFILFNHLHSVKLIEDLHNNPSKHDIINQMLKDSISNNLWKFVILRLLQTENLEMSQINREMIIAQCFDLLHIALFLEDIARTSSTFIFLNKSESFENRIRGRVNIV